MSRLAAWAFLGDVKLFYHINHAWRRNCLDTIMPWITELGGPVFTILSCLVFYLAGRGMLAEAAVHAIFALAFSHGLAFIVKLLFTRPRPYMVLPGCNTLTGPLKDYSFPSGHTTAAFSLAVSYAMYFPLLTLPLLFLAAATGISRIYMGVHFPSDVATGAVLGGGTALLLVLV